MKLQEAIDKMVLLQHESAVVRVLIEHIEHFLPDEFGVATEEITVPYCQVPTVGPKVLEAMYTKLQDMIDAGEAEARKLEELVVNE